MRFNDAYQMFRKTELSGGSHTGSNSNIPEVTRQHKSMSWNEVSLLGGNPSFIDRSSCEERLRHQALLNPPPMVGTGPTLLHFTAPEFTQGSMATFQYQFQESNNLHCSDLLGHSHLSPSLADEDEDGYQRMQQKHARIGEGGFESLVSTGGTGFTSSETLELPLVYPLSSNPSYLFPSVFQSPNGPQSGMHDGTV